MRALILILAAGLVAAEEGMMLIPTGEFSMGRTRLTPDDKTTMRPQVLLDDRAGPRRPPGRLLDGRHGGGTRAKCGLP